MELGMPCLGQSGGSCRRVTSPEPWLRNVRLHNDSMGFSLCSVTELHNSLGQFRKRHQLTLATVVLAKCQKKKKEKKSYGRGIVL